MNKARRKGLYALIRGLNKVKFNDNLDSYVNTLDDIKYEEEYAHNSTPDNLQYSYRAGKAEEAIEHMEDALDLLNDASDCEDEAEFLDYIRNAINEIQAAIV